MSVVHTDADFERLSWHDGRLWGLAMRAGSADEADWTSDLVLDIDFIVEWLPAADGTRFRVAPATLVFHGVTDLKATLDSGDSGFRVALPEVTLDRIGRACRCASGREPAGRYLTASTSDWARARPWSGRAAAPAW